MQRTAPGGVDTVLVGAAADGDTCGDAFHPGAVRVHGENIETAVRTQTVAGEDDLLSAGGIVWPAIVRIARWLRKLVNVSAVEPHLIEGGRNDGRCVLISHENDMVTGRAAGQSSFERSGSQALLVGAVGVHNP